MLVAYAVSRARRCHSRRRSAVRARVGPGRPRIRACLSLSSSPATARGDTSSQSINNETPRGLAPPTSRHHETMVPRSPSRTRGRRTNSSAAAGRSSPSSSRPPTAKATRVLRTSPNAPLAPESALRVAAEERAQGQGSEPALEGQDWASVVAGAWAQGRSSLVDLLFVLGNSYSALPALSVLHTCSPLRLLSQLVLAPRPGWVRNSSPYHFSRGGRRSSVK